MTIVSIIIIIIMNVSAVTVMMMMRMSCSVDRTDNAATNTTSATISTVLLGDLVHHSLRELSKAVAVVRKVGLEELAQKLLELVL